MVKVEGLSFAYNRAAGDVLHDINFEAENGKCLAILGNNGAGKSTLIKCIDRICPVGEMNRAKSGWHHDGGFNILDLVRAVDIERNTDRYADTFDIDYE